MLAKMTGWMIGGESRPARGDTQAPVTRLVIMLRQLSFSTAVIHADLDTYTLFGQGGTPAR